MKKLTLNVAFIPVTYLLMQNYLASETGATGFYVDMQTDTDDCETNDVVTDF